MYAKIQQNIKYKNIHKEKRCFILGNGPSLVDLDFSLLQNEITFTVNYLYKNPDFKKINTNYHVLADPGFFNIHELPIVLNQIKELAESPKFFIEADGYEVVKEANLDKNYEIAFFKFMISVDDLDFMSIDLTSMFPYFNTVVQSAIAIAMYMGFSKIYLLGCDCTGILNYIQRKLGSDTTQYGYQLSKEDQIKILKNINLNGDLSSEHMFFEWYRIFQSYRLLDIVCKKKDISLINLTNKGILDVLEKSTLSNILKKE